MLNTKDIDKMRVYVFTKKNRMKKYARVRNVVFHPTKPRAIGIIVELPDVLWMFPRKDRFLAFDSVEFDEDKHIMADLDNDDAWDGKACKRLDIQWDDCILWENMPVKSEKGEVLGTISNVALKEPSFKIDHIDISHDGMSRAILGSTDIGRSEILGYQDGAIIVGVEATDIEEAGGLAAKAGEAWAKGSHAASQAGSKAATTAGAAINKGAHKTGQVIGTLRSKVADAVQEEPEASSGTSPSSRSNTTSEAKKTSAASQSASKKKSDSGQKARAVGRQLGKFGSMFKDFKDEYDKASK